MPEFKCVRCGDRISHNIYYCSHCEWHLCWDCIKKSIFTNELTCSKCGKKVHRVD